MLGLVTTVEKPDGKLISLFELPLEGEAMLVEKMRDLWICSCGNWVPQGLTWCLECCEDRDVPTPMEDSERQKPPKFGHH
jgi:hypothetical protein